MNRINIFDIKGTVFPSGRETRVIVGDNGVINGEYFCQGYVVVYPGGFIPEHEHEAEETYTILEGTGEMTIDGETQSVKRGDCVYVEENLSHCLANTGDVDLHMMFVYAPNFVVDHWARELSGEL